MRSTLSTDLLRFKLCHDVMHTLRKISM